MPGLPLSTRLTVASLTPTYLATSASLRVTGASVVHVCANGLHWGRAIYEDQLSANLVQPLPEGSEEPDGRELTREHRPGQTQRPARPVRGRPRRHRRGGRGGHR